MTETAKRKVPWWIWRPVQERLVKWTLALLQGRRYRVRLRVGGTGKHNPKTREIHANPEMFRNEPDDVQFRVTQGILAHEVGHAFFTDAWPEAWQNILCQLVNMLEDARIERAITVLYPGVSPAIRLVGDLCYRDVPSKVTEMAPPLMAFGACLWWRWACDRDTEANFQSIALLDDPEATSLWSQVRPLVEASWSAANTLEVIRLAKDILLLLDIPESRVALDLPFVDYDVPQERDDDALPFPADPADVQPGLGTPNVHEHGRGHTPAQVEPQPYIDIEDAARPLAGRLVQALRVPRPERSLTPVEAGGRYHFRQEIRTPDTPFLYMEDVADDNPPAAIHLLVDRSGSMGYIDESVRLALMMVWLAGQELETPVSISYFGDGCEPSESEFQPVDTVAGFGERDEMAKALIAGFRGHTGAEFLHWGLEVAEKSLRERPEREKVIVIVHDGQPVWEPDEDTGGPTDWQLSLADIERLNRHGYLVVGVYLGTDSTDRTQMEQLFAGRLIACSAEQLPEKLGSMLRSLLLSQH